MAIQEIPVGLREGPDPRGEALKSELEQSLGILTIAKIDTSSVYKYEGITPQEADVLRDKALVDPVTQQTDGEESLDQNENPLTIEIGKKPGVMDPDEEEMLRVARLLHIQSIAAETSTIYSIYGNLSPEEIEAIKSHLPSQVEQVVEEPPETFILDSEAPSHDTVSISDLDTDGLQELSDKHRLFLNPHEMQVIQNYYANLDREPTDIEIETIAQTWSEHNGHKTFKAKLFTTDGKEKTPLISRIRNTAERYYQRVGIVSAFVDNAGVIDVGNGKDGIAIKAETHNSPVAIEPFGGAATKGGGVYRDVAGTGKVGKNLVSLMANCFAPPDMDRGKLPKGALDPLYLLKENSHGERDYGNKMGIPTHGTNLHFDENFRAKPTSMGIAIGVIPLDRAEKGSPQPGNAILTVGGRTGRDGIHGATFSSGEMTADTKQVDGTAVQIGNPIEEERVFSALEACADEGLIEAVTDCGGGGYSSAIGEIGEKTGVKVHLDQVPTKYEGLAPWEIWLSESQERMVLAVDKSNIDAIYRICKLHDAPVHAIGEFTDDNKLTIMYNGEGVGELPMEFLHDGLPQREMQMEYKMRESQNEIPPEPTDWQDSFEKVLGHLNVCSKEAMLRQYDQTVKGLTVLEPFTGVHNDSPNDASVVRGGQGESWGVVTAHGLNPVLNKDNPYWGSKWAFARAINNFVAHGGNPNKAALIDNFVWPFPDAESLGDLDRSVDALCEGMDAYELPCISGKDSLSSTYRGEDGEVIKIPPVLNISVVGPISNLDKTTSADIKKTDSVLCYLGNMNADQMGGSIYFDTNNINNSHIPEVDFKQQRDIANAVYEATQAGSVKSCKSIGEGGIAAALSMMCFGGDCGAEVDVDNLSTSRTDFALFNETPGLLVELSSEDEAEELFGEVPHVVLGKTTTDKTISIKSKSEQVASIDIDSLKHVWQKPMRQIYS